MKSFILQKEMDLKLEIGARRTSVVVYEDVERPFRNNATTNRRISKGGNEKGEQSVANYKRRIRDRTDLFYALTFNNFQPDHASMITLTFAPGHTEKVNPQELAECHGEFKRFIQRINYRFNGFKYAAVFNRQRCGNWHYHMISNLTSISNKEIEDIWQNGIAYYSTIGNESVLREKAQYCVKNLREASNHDDLMWAKGYLCSKGLQRNLTLRTWSDEVEYKKCWTIFNQIRDSPSRIVYTAEHTAGVKFDIINEDGSTSTICQRDVKMEENFQCSKVEEWKPKYHHVQSEADLSYLFHKLASAVRKKSKAFL